MKNIIFISIFFVFAGLGNCFAQESASTHVHETEAPEPSEEIRMEKKNSKKHEHQLKKEKERHAKHNLKMEKRRLRHSGDATFGAIGYDNGGKYSARAHKRHLKAKKD